MPIITLWHIWAWFPVAMLFSLCYFYSRNSVSEELQPALTQSKVAIPVSGAVSCGPVIPKFIRIIACKQPYDAFLVFDVEATCQQGTDFTYPNEIIEFPVCLMMWKDRNGDKARQLELIDEFRSFVKPSWRPMLSQFCKDLTGITQEQVDAASDFPTVLRSFRAFLVQHKLIEKNGKRRRKFCWCSDGPWDIRDFVVKQCFISKMQLPDWMSGDVLDVRQLVTVHTALRKPQRGPSRTLNIPAQLSAFGLPPFQGRLHSGIDDTRNLARILKQLALENVRLQPNTPINPRRRWYWMGKSGQILEDRL